MDKIKIYKDLALIFMSVAISILFDGFIKNLYDLVCTNENVFRFVFFGLLSVIAVLLYMKYLHARPKSDDCKK